MNKNTIRRQNDNVKKFYGKLVSYAKKSIKNGFDRKMIFENRINETKMHDKNGLRTNFLEFT